MGRESSSFAAGTGATQLLLEILQQILQGESVPVQAKSLVPVPVGAVSYRKIYAVGTDPGTISTLVGSSLPARYSLRDAGEHPSIDEQPFL
jgi:hypothetical protein